MKLTAWFAALLLSLQSWAVVAQQGLQPVPSLERRVTDLAGVLSSSEQTTLEEKLAAFETRKGAQVAVLIVSTTQPEEIEQYSIRVVDAWKLGRKSIDDGALLIVAVEDRRLRIEVGRGLEGALTDLASNRIIQETITPRFREGDYAGGIGAGVDRMIGVIDGEPLPEPKVAWEEGKGGGFGEIFGFLFVLSVFISALLHKMLGRFFGSMVTGGVAGGLALLITGAVGLALLAAFASFFVALIFGGSSASGLVTRGGRHHRGRDDGWGGGFGGGGFGGGGFGGGFGGGGGGFGGGGASGRW